MELSFGKSLCQLILRKHEMIEPNGLIACPTKYLGGQFIHAVLLAFRWQTCTVEYLLTGEELGQMGIREGDEPIRSPSGSLLNRLAETIGRLQRQSIDEVEIHGSPRGTENLQNLIDRQ